MRWKFLTATSAALSLCGTSAAEETLNGGDWNILSEFVYMRRAEISNTILVMDSDVHECRNGCLSSRVMDSKDLVNGFGFEPGFRVGVSYDPDIKSSYETTFLYVSEWENQETKKADGTLFYPFHNPQYTEDFFGADKAQGRYQSQFYTLELNYWRNFSRRYLDYFGLSAIFGLRYFHIHEKFKLAFTDQTFETGVGSETSDYTAKTRNDLIGMQVGGNLQINASKYFYMDMLAKVGLALNRAADKVFLGDQGNSVTLRDFHKQKWQDVFFADAAMGFGSQPLPFMNLHIGYEVLYLSGLALAPEQINRSSSFNNTRLFTKGWVVIHGLYAGVTWSF